MVRHVPEIILQTGAELRYSTAMQPVHGLQQRLRRMSQDHQFLLDRVKRFDACPLGLFRKDPLLDSFQFRGYGIEHGKIAVHYRVHQSIKHVARAVTQKFLLSLPPIASLEESFLPLSTPQKTV